MTHSPYPSARRQDLVENLPEPDGSLAVADPYRWLEDAESDETAAWTTAQDEFFASKQGAWADNGAVRERLAELNSAGVVGTPAWRGDAYFNLRRTGTQEHAVLVHTQDGTERVLLDPMELNPDGTTTLDIWQPSKDGKLLAYQISEGGREESVLYVMDVATGENVDGPIDRARYSPTAWLPDGRSFFYVRQLAPDLVPADEAQYHRRVYWHQVGDDPANDVEVFGEGQNILNYYHVAVSMDGRWVTLMGQQGTDPRNDLYVAELASATPHVPTWRTVISGEDCRAYGRVEDDGRLWIFTDRSAPRGHLVTVDPASPAPENWQIAVAERDDAVLEEFALLTGDNVPGGPEVVVRWTQHAVGQITRHDAATGELRGAVDLPGIGTVTDFSVRPKDGHETWFTYTDYATVPQVLEYNAITGAVTVFAEPPGAPTFPPLATKQVEYTSKDGTTIRMFVISRADSVDTDGAPTTPAPTVLYGYGGFGMTLSPAFASGIVKWVEDGGRYVITGLRGGGEEGEEWHRAGMFGNKQNVFDDFLAAADALVVGGYTTTEQLAISGGSNGGLLVGAAVTQAPEKFAAVVCSAPLLDMVRFQWHGLGQTWAGEYGDARKADDLAWLHAYSPYHRVEENTEYPAMMFTIFDGDTRVDPCHARKMCAAMQHATTSDPESKPIVYRLERKVGHGARSLSRTMDLQSDIFLFMGHHTGWPRS